MNWRLCPCLPWLGFVATGCAHLCCCASQLDEMKARLLEQQCKETAVALGAYELEEQLEAERCSSRAAQDEVARLKTELEMSSSRAAAAQLSHVEHVVRLMQCRVLWPTHD